MHTLFLFCAVLGGTLVVCQFLATLLGIGGDHDFDHGGHVGGDHDAHGGHHSDIFKLLTFRAITAGLAFFGLTGLAADAAELTPLPTVVLAGVVGFAAMWSIAWLMQQISNLRTDGTVQASDAVGRDAVVYLSIPADQHAAGKIHVNVRDRTVELEARSANGAFPTGSSVRVTRVLGPELVEVTSA